MRTILDLASTVIVALAAVAMLGLYVHDRSSTTEDEGTYAEGWESWEPAFHFGPADAPLKVDVFMDFTCPYCARLHPVLDSAITRFEGRLTIRFHHFPLRGHEYGFDGAVAADCAQRQGMFEPMYDQLYLKRDSIGEKSWRSFATDAGVNDLEEFETCLERPRSEFTRVSAGRELGERIGVRGTPGIWVNGWRYPQGRTVEAFVEKAEELGVSPGS